LLYDTSPTVLYTLSLHDALPILNFLDVFGSWDPSLAFVMGGAVIVAFFGYRVVLKRRAPLTGGSFRLPSRSDIDSRILVGPAIRSEEHSLNSSHVKISYAVFCLK